MISVITSAYNAAHTLARTIRSVQAQSHPDFEYLIVDHGSTDATGSLIDRFVQRDSRIKRLTLKENHGFIGRALNCALDAAQGEYVVFLDADDAYEPDFLKKMLHFMGKDGLDIAICGFRRVDETDTEIRTDTIKEPVLAIDLAGYECLWQQFTVCSFGYLYVWWNKMYRRSYLDGMRFPEDCFVHGDAIFQARLLKGMPRIYCATEPLVRWSCVLGSMSYGVYKQGYYKEAVDAACAFADLSERFVSDSASRRQCVERLALSLPHLRRLEHYKSTPEQRLSELIDWITYPPYWKLIEKAGLQGYVREYMKSFFVEP